MWILVLVFGTLVSGGFVVWVSFEVAPPIEGNWDNFVKVTGIGFTLITCVVAAAASIFNARRQIKANYGLEIFKSDLATDLELVKKRLEIKTQAFYQLLDAAYEYYFALDALQNGVYDVERVSLAERKMQESRKYLDLGKFEEAQKRLWINFWQRGRGISESVASLETDQGEKKSG